MSIIRKDVSEHDLSKPSEETTLQTLLKTKLALEDSIQGKIAVAKTCPDTKAKISNLSYYNYQDKIIQIHEQPSDPILTAKFKHRRVPRGPVEPPTPIDRSPPRKLTLKDQLD